MRILLFLTLPNSIRSLKYDVHTPCDPSPCLRWLVLREFPPGSAWLHGGASVRPAVAPVLDAQEADGVRGDLAWRGGPLRMTLLALMRLGFLGFGPDLPAIQRGAEFLFSVTGTAVRGRWQVTTAKMRAVLANSKATQ